MSVGGEAKPLSYDHKPTNAAETSRIVAGGGFVEFGRVNGEHIDVMYLSGMRAHHEGRSL